jgi:streptomycin 6-kinase
VDGTGLASGAGKAAWLADFISRTWRKLDRPCSERAIERALEYATERAQALHGLDPVLVHGDAHPWNVLEAPRDDLAGGRGELSFRLIDPEGLASEPAHDLGVVLRGWNEELLANDVASAAFERCDSVSRQAGVERDGIWRWSYIERVSSGLFLLELGHRAEGRPYLDVADRLAEVELPWS